MLYHRAGAQDAMVMTDIVPQIPAYFWKIPYDRNHDRHSPILPDISQGANCQNFAYELLRHFGWRIPNLRSSNLWEDSEYTIAVTDYRPLDLVLFSRTHDAFGAHVAVHVGSDRAVHLSRRLGFAAVWPLEEFASYPKYRILVGAKRPILCQ